MGIKITRLMERNKEHRKICLVCGATETLNGVPYVDDFVFCSCCFFHYGIDDNEIEPLMFARENWFKEGLPFGASLEPKDKLWTLEIVKKQLESLTQIDKSFWPEYVLKRNNTWSSHYDESKLKSYWNLYREINKAAP